MLFLVKSNSFALSFFFFATKKKAINVSFCRTAKVLTAVHIAGAAALCKAGPRPIFSELYHVIILETKAICTCKIAHDESIKYFGSVVNIVFLK